MVLLELMGSEQMTTFWLANEQRLETMLHSSLRQATMQLLCKMATTIS